MCNKPQHSIIKILLMLFIIIWIIGKVIGYILLIPHPWGPEVRGSLPDGGYIIFQSRSIGGETDDRLTLITAKGQRHDFIVDQIHAGFDYDTIKIKDDGMGVWVESDEKVGASLDLTTREFYSEQHPQFKWAKFGNGKVIAEGKTWSILYLLLPW